MKKLKQILQSKIFLIILCVVTLVYVWIITSHKYYHTRYSEKTSTLIGIITDIKIDGNKVTIKLKGKEKVIVNYYMKSESEVKKFKKYKLGNKLIVKGNMSVPSENTNFNLFNYRNYLLSNKIYWVFNASQIKPRHTNNNLLYGLKNSIKRRIDKIDNSYLNTFILGDNSGIDTEVINSYRTNGISHLFALSGMHVSLITMFLLKLLSGINKREKINYVVVSIFLFFYMFLTNFTPPITRSSLFFIILFLNNKRFKTLNLFIIFTCIMLYYNPYFIYNNAFLFSYSITLYLIVFSKAIKKFKNYFLKILIVSLISLLASIPVMINSYFSVNIIGFVFNLFYIPFISFIILPLTFITFFIPILGDLLSFLTDIVESTSLFLTNISFGNITLCHVGMIPLIGYYILISLVIYKVSRSRYQYLICIGLLLLIHNNINLFNKNLIITMLDVGQGDSLLIQLPHDKGNILVDTGGKINFTNESWKKRKKPYSIAEGTIIPYLKSMGIKKLHYLILTHGDADHIGEAIKLVESFKIEKTIFNCGEYNELEHQLIKVLDKGKLPYYSCIQKLNIDNNILYFLNDKIYYNENDNSNVIYTKLNNYQFLFMGDAGVDTESDLLKQYKLNNIDVLKVGHHGSKTSSSKEFIDEINPKYSLISVGQHNRYGHPNEEVLDNLKYSKVYRTDQDGSIMLKIKNNKLKIQRCNP